MAIQGCRVGRLSHGLRLRPQVLFQVEGIEKALVLPERSRLFSCACSSGLMGEPRLWSPPLLSPWLLLWGFRERWHGLYRCQGLFPPAPGWMTFPLKPWHSQEARHTELRLPAGLTPRISLLLGELEAGFTLPPGLWPPLGWAASPGPNFESPQGGGYQRED